MQLIESPDGSKLATVDKNGTVKVLDLTKRRQIPIPDMHGPWDGYISLPFESSDRPVKVHFTPDAGKLLVIGCDGEFTIQDLSTLKIDTYSQLKIEHKIWVSVSQLSPDGSILALAGQGIVKVLNLKTREELTRREGGVKNLFFSLDGCRLLVVAAAGDVSFFNAKTGQRLPEEYGIGSWINQSSISPDHSKLQLRLV